MLANTPQCPDGQLFVQRRNRCPRPTISCNCIAIFHFTG